MLLEPNISDWGSRVAKTGEGAPCHLAALHRAVYTHSHEDVGGGVCLLSRPPTHVISVRRQACTMNAQSVSLPR